jgi:hypothetical protein
MKYLRILIFIDKFLTREVRDIYLTGSNFSNIAFKNIGEYI